MIPTRIIAWIGVILACIAISMLLGHMSRAHSFTAEEKLDIDCDRMMYSDNWTLGYLRNMTAYCSNGG